jgi:hypothetical protein
MNINTLIKKAINDNELRKNLFARPVEVCKKFGIEVSDLAFNKVTLNPVVDTSLMQGGYRP